MITSVILFNRSRSVMEESEFNTEGAEKSFTEGTEKPGALLRRVLCVQAFWMMSRINDSVASVLRAVD